MIPYGIWMHSADSYSSLARDEAIYQSYLEENASYPESLYDDKGIEIAPEENFVETAEGIFSLQTLEEIGNSCEDLYQFIKTIFGEEKISKEEEEYLEDYFEDGNYYDLIFEYDLSSTKTND